MGNPFYTPTGNPVTGSEGLSLLIRTEFLAISTAFDMVPAITTTGLFATIFNQTGNYTYTLPPRAGTLALTSDIAASVTAASTPAAFGAAFLAWMAQLPTVLPPSAGVAWNNGGLPSVS